MLDPQDLFDLSSFAHAGIFEGCTFVWEPIAFIEKYIERQFSTALRPAIRSNIPGHAAIEGDVYIGKGVVIEPETFIKGPAIIGDDCQIRQGAYIRGNLILGNKCIVGHATEVKNAIFLNKAQAPHFAYVGDSILGNSVNLGAGTRVANVPLLSINDPVTSKRPSIRLKIGDQEIDTGLSKFGAVLGDNSQTGCNAVISPGCIIGRGCRIYALVSLRKGYYPPNSIVKLRQETEVVARE